MVKYVKKNRIEKPVWIDPLFPAFRGLLDAVLQKVKVQSKSNLCVGGFIERTTREATLYEQTATTYLLKTLEPLSLELEVARKKSAAPLPENTVQDISTTEAARLARRVAAQQAQAAADKAAAEEKAAKIENKMLQQIALTENDIAETYTKICINQAIKIGVWECLAGRSMGAVKERMAELMSQGGDALCISTVRVIAKCLKCDGIFLYVNLY